MPTDNTRTTAGIRALPVALALTLIATLAIPSIALGAVTGVTPASQAQGTVQAITVDGSGGTFPTGAYTITFSGTGVTATGVTRASAVALTATVTVTAGATPGVRTLTVTGPAGFGAPQTTSYTITGAVAIDTTTTITSHTPDPSLVGSAVSVGVSVAAVSGTTSPTGSVTVADGTTTSAPCTLSGSGGTATATCTLTPTTSGAKTLTATYGGVSGFNGSSGTASHTVLAAQVPLVLTGTSSPATIGDTQALGTTGGSGTGAVSYTSTTPAVCTVSGTTLSIVAGTGTCSVYATKAADADYASATSATVDITAQKADTVTTVTCPAGPFTYTGSAQTPCTATFTAPGSPSVPFPVTYTDNTDAGTATASASFAGSADYNPSTDSTTFTVGPAGLVVTPDPVGVTFGDPVPAYPFTVTGFVAGEDAGTAAGYVAPTCTSAYTAATPVAASPLTITCSGGSADNYTFDTTATAALTISNAAQAALVLTGTSSPAVYGDTQALGTTGGSGTGAVTFSTGASTACSVSGSTLTITAGSGTCQVTATKAADADYAEATSAPVDITVGPAGLVVTPDPVGVTFGDPVPAYPFTVTGFVAGEDAGTAAGYVAPTCTSAYTAATPVAASPLTITCSGGSADNYTFDTTATAALTISNADAVCTIAGVSVTWDGAPHGASGSCVGVNSETLSGLDLGDTFTDVPGGTADWTLANPNYNGQSGSVAVTISQATQAIEFPPLPDVTYGVPSFALAATTDSGLPITYASLTPSVCTVSGATVTIVGVGSCTIVASQAGNGNVLAAQSVPRTFEVAAADDDTPDTSTIPSLGVTGGDGPFQRTLLLGLLSSGILAATIALFGYRAGRDPVMHRRRRR